MNRETMSALRLDRRLLTRKDWVDEGELESALEALPDVSHKIAPPKPIPPLPPKDEFVIPKFIGEGDGKKKLAPIAEVEESEGPTNPRSAAGGRRAPTEEERRVEFERAAERALRDRLVPPAERAIVKRYFAELLKPPK